MFTKNKFAKLQLLFAVLITFGSTLLVTPTYASHEGWAEDGWTFQNCADTYQSNLVNKQKCEAEVLAHGDTNDTQQTDRERIEALCNASAAGNSAPCIWVECGKLATAAAVSSCRGTMPDPTDGTPSGGTVTGDQDGNAPPVDDWNDNGIPDVDESESSGTSENCESKGGSFSFVVCPLLSFLNQAFTTLDNWIVNALNVDSDYYKADSEVKQVWENIRNIAYFILIPIMLLMVIGTALNVGFLDPYTVRRAMPRLLTAVVFMALSFNVCVFLIQVSNTVGRGIAGVIAQPFDGMENLELTDIFNPGIGSDALMVGGVVGAVALGFAGFATIGIIASFLFVGVVTLLIIFVLLAFRELLIIFLMVMSPIAILSWIFKGNDKMWKLWWGTFSKLLMLFPIVMAFLVMGRAFARIAQAAGTADGGGDVFTTIIKLIAFISPYFLIPSAFKFAGGAFGNIAGMANDRSRGFFDKQRKKRGESYGKMRHDYKTGDLYKGRNTFTRRVNNMGERVGVGSKGRFGVGAVGSEALTLQREVNNEERMKQNPMLQKLTQTDDDGTAMLALGGGSIQGHRRAQADLKRHWTDTTMNKWDKANNWNEATATPEQTAARNATLVTAQSDASNRVAQASAAATAVGINRSNAGAAMVGLAQNKARSLQGPNAIKLVEAGAARLSGADASVEYLMDPETGQSVASVAKSGGNDSVASNTIQGYMYHARGNGRHDQGDDSLEKAWGRQSIGAIVAGDTKSVDNFAQHMQKEWGSNNPERMKVAARWASELQGAEVGATDGNREIISKTLTNMGFDHNMDRGLEDQFASRINSAGAAAPVTGEDIFRSARKYSKDMTETERLRYQREMDEREFRRRSE